MTNKFGPYFKAIAGALVAGASYLIGAIPASGGFGDVAAVAWLGLIVAVFGSGGVVWAVPNKP